MELKESIKIIEIYSCDDWRTTSSMGREGVFSTLDPDWLTKVVEQIIELVDADESSLEKEVKELIKKYKETNLTEVASTEIAEKIFAKAREQLINYVEINILTLNEDGTVEF